MIDDDHCIHASVEQCLQLAVHERRRLIVLVGLRVEIVVVIVIVIIPVVVFVLIFFIVVIIFGLGDVGTRPAFRLLDLVEVEFSPGVDIDFLDVAIEVLDLDQFRVLIHRQHAKAVVFIDVLVPLAHHGLEFSGHCSDPRPCRRSAAPGRILGSARLLRQRGRWRVVVRSVGCDMVQVLD